MDLKDKQKENQSVNLLEESSCRVCGNGSRRSVNTLSEVCQLIFDKEGETMVPIDSRDLLIRCLAVLFISVLPGAIAVSGTQSGLNKYSLAQ